MQEKVIVHVDEVTVVALVAEILGELSLKVTQSGCGAFFHLLVGYYSLVSRL